MSEPTKGHGKTVYYGSRPVCSPTGDLQLYCLPPDRPHCFPPEPLSCLSGRCGCCRPAGSCSPRQTGWRPCWTQDCTIGRCCCSRPKAPSPWWCAWRPSQPRARLRATLSRWASAGPGVWVVVLWLLPCQVAAVVAALVWPASQGAGGGRLAALAAWSPAAAALPGQRAAVVPAAMHEHGQTPF